MLGSLLNVDPVVLIIAFLLAGHFILKSMIERAEASFNMFMAIFILLVFLGVIAFN